MADTSARIWDLPLRLFHWSWAATFAAAWLLEGDRTLYWHLLAGYLFGALLLFRLAWGLAGTTWARFSAFAYGPGRALGYLKAVLRGEATRYPGHNPAVKGRANCNACHRHAVRGSLQRTRDPHTGVCPL